MNIWRISCHGQSFPEANAADELSFNCIYSGRSPLSTVFLSAYETREVIHLRLAGDFSFRDIGDILGHSEVWARVRFYRGKEKLVKIIGGDNNA